MSLTSFLRDNGDVRERFRNEFKKPDLSATKELVAPPLSKRYGTVGTAFDYLFRFRLQYLNPKTIDKGYWVAEKAVERLADKPALFKKGQKIVSQARARLADYLKKGQMCGALIESALLLATLDPIFRAGVGHEMIGSAHKDDIQDLKNLMAAIDEKLFKARKLCVINPTFGRASSLVGGADADLVIDETIIDIKTTQELSLRRSAFNQLLGYYVLHHIAGVGEIRPKPAITKVAIYFSRHALLHVMQLSEIVNTRRFPKFVQWFKQRAAEEGLHARPSLRPSCQPLQKKSPPPLPQAPGTEPRST